MKAKLRAGETHLANNRTPLRGFDQRHSLYNQMQSTIADVFD